MNLKLDDLRKLESATVPAQPVDSKKLLNAIVKLKKPNYVPKDVRVRAQISPVLITCEFPAEHLAILEKDQNVESISLNKPLRSEEEPR